MIKIKFVKLVFLFGLGICLFFLFTQFSSDAFRPIAGDTMVEFVWEPSSDEEVIGYMIRRGETRFPRSLDEGTFVYAGNGIELKGVECDRGLENGKIYYYSLFSLDQHGKVSRTLTRTAIPKKARAHFNYIQNGDFSQGWEHWEKSATGEFKQVDVKAAFGGKCAQLRSQKEIALTQQTLPLLKPKTLYTCTCAMRASSCTAACSIDGGIQNRQQPSGYCAIDTISPKKCEKSGLVYGFGPITYMITDDFWRECRFVFWTGSTEDVEHPFDGSVTLTLTMVPSASQEGVAAFTDIRIVEGLLPMPSKPLDPQHPFIPSLNSPMLPPMQLQSIEWNFAHGLDPDQWMVLDAMGSDDKNISVDHEGNLLITAWGNEAATPQKGALIFSKRYLASGRYDLWAKIGPFYGRNGDTLVSGDALGCAFTFWNYNLIAYADSEPQWYDDPSPLRNSEIDWEMPGDYPLGNAQTSYPFCPLISWKNSRLSAWGGQKGSETIGNVTVHVPLPFDASAADGAFHQYTLIWNSGIDHGDGTRTPGYIEWYLDTGDEPDPAHLAGRWEGGTYGFDNIPFRSMRLAFSAWFPKLQEGYGKKTCVQQGWAGTPVWEKAEFRIKKIQYTPYFQSGQKPNRDRWQGGTESLLHWFP